MGKMDKTKQAIEIFDLYAQRYQEKYMDQQLYAEGLELFCQTLPKKKANVFANILDVACGPGNITQFLLEQSSQASADDFNILGIDLSPKMLGLARINNPAGADFKCMDARSIATQLVVRVDESPFDGIVCGFGLPYLSKEEAIQFIKDATKLIAPNGVLYLSTMEGRYQDSGYQKSSSGGDDNQSLFIYFHEAKYLLEALDSNDWETLNISRSHNPQESTNTNDLIIVARKQTNAPPSSCSSNASETR